MQTDNYLRTEFGYITKNTRGFQPKRYKVLKGPRTGKIIKSVRIIKIKEPTNEAIRED